MITYNGNQARIKVDICTRNIHRIYKMHLIAAIIRCYVTFINKQIKQSITQHLPPSPSGWSFSRWNRVIKPLGFLFSTYLEDNLRISGTDFFNHEKSATVFILSWSTAWLLSKGMVLPLCQSTKQLSSTTQMQWQWYSSHNSPLAFVYTLMPLLMRRRSLK